MRKKIIPILLIIVMLSSFLTGCAIWTVNPDRDNAQIITTVTYKGNTSLVTKQDVKDGFNSYGYMYVQYYGFTYEEAYDEVALQLGQRELLLMVAKETLSEAKGIDWKTAELTEFLTTAEINHAKESYNTTMTTLFDNFLDEVIADEEAMMPEEDDEEEDEEDIELPDLLAPRPTRPELEEPIFDSEMANKPTTEVVELFEDTNNYNEIDNPQEYKAINELERTLKSLNKEYSDFLLEEYETSILESYQRYMSDTIEVTDEDLQAIYDEILKENKELFEDNEDSYIAALAGDLSQVIYHDNIDQFYVYNILLKFSPEQEATLKAFMTDNPNYSDEAIESLRNTLISQIKVDVSNPNFDVETVEDEENWIKGTESDIVDEDGYLIDDNGHKVSSDINSTATAYGYIIERIETGDNANVSYYDAIKAIAPAYEKTTTEGKVYLEFKYDVPAAVIMAIIDYDLTQAEGINELRETFIKWMYMVNDDPGMFDETTNVNGYILSKSEDDDSPYVDEFTEYSRGLMNQANAGIGAYKYGDEYGVTTDYGIHLIMVSYIPFNSNSSDVDTVNNSLGLDYIIEYGRDSEDNMTLGDVLKKAELTKLQTAYYNKLIMKLNEKHEKDIVVNSDLYVDLYKEADKALEK